MAALPYSLRVLAENVIRSGIDCSDEVLRAISTRSRSYDIPFRPARVVLQDLLGTPALVDLAGLRDAVAERGGDPTAVNPKIPTHLIIDHSVNTNAWGSADAMDKNMELEQQKNSERFAFFDWCNKAFDNLTIVPPGKGIIHQINLERLTTVIATEEVDGATLAYPDTLVGTDSHTTMINGIGVLGWGVGGIEAEAAMLGRSLTMRLPEIVGIYLDGKPPQGYTVTDIALTLTEMLREAGVVSTFLEFHGPGVAELSLADRATISNMAPEFGASGALFPIDEKSIDYLNVSGRGGKTSALVEAYAKQQGLWRDSLEQAQYDRVYSLDLATVGRCIAGPNKPHQRIVLGNEESLSQQAVATEASELKEGDVVLAAITSCTNTSNPRNVIAAALLARKALARGLKRAPLVKTSFAPGSKVVTDYLEAAGLDKDLDALGFNVVGYGCMSCNGMSGPLINTEVEEQIREEKLNVAAVTSGNRNFAGRVHPLAREVFIMSPPLIVAYALAGTVKFDPEVDPIAFDDKDQPVYLHEIWPSDEEIAAIEAGCLNSELFEAAYEQLSGPATRGAVDNPDEQVSPLYAWDEDSTYIRKPPYWDKTFGPSEQLDAMKPLAMLGDHITTDHISPSGAILAESDAGRYLLERGIGEAEFNSYGTRRGNHEAAQRATFASPRLINEICADDSEGPYTCLLPDGTKTTIFTAACGYQTRKQPLLVIAGKEYGSGSSRDWAAKGPRLLGVRVVLAESFERIHRANLAGLGILPLQFVDGENRKTLDLSGRESYSVEALAGLERPDQELTLTIDRGQGETSRILVRCRLETEEEIRYFRNGGLLPTLCGEYL